MSFHIGDVVRYRLYSVITESTEIKSGRITAYKNENGEHILIINSLNDNRKEGRRVLMDDVIPDIPSPDVKTLKSI